jgi:ribosomal protein S18 acetylase RimI-like enzyme
VVASVAVTWEDLECWGEAGGDGAAGYVHALVRDRSRTAPGTGEGLLRWAEVRIGARGRPLSRLDTRSRAARLLRYYEAHGYGRVGSARLPGHSPLTLFEKRLPAGRAPDSARVAD